MTIKEVCERYGITQDTVRYYERVGAVPKVGRTKGGIRDYSEEDAKWIRNAVCMRSAGMSVEAIAKYVQLYQQGPDTISERLDLLAGEREKLLKQREELEKTINLLNYKISRYEEAVETGILRWD